MAQVVQLTLASQWTEIPRALAALESCARQAGISGRPLMEMELALEEMLTNILQYGFADATSSHTLTLRLHCDDTRLVAELLDDGIPFNPLADAPPPDLSAPLEERRVRGLGVHLAKRMVDELDYFREGRCNHLVLTKRMPDLPSPAHPPERTWSLGPELSEIPQLAEEVEGFLKEHGVPPKVIFSLNLALDELLTNTLSYGFTPEEGERQVRVRMRLERGQITTELEDNGRPFDPLSDAPEPDLNASLEERRVGGLGVHLVKKMVDSVRYHHAEGHNHLLLSKSLSNP